MNKIIFISILAGSMLLTACTQSENVGVIGGADGPTAIYTSDGKNEITEQKPVRMIRIDGDLYYDSGKLSDVTGRCGNLDGNLTKSAGEYEVPQNDGGCNFDGADGYQLTGDENTKEIPIGSDWLVFQKISDSEKDLTGYKYCYYVRGTMPNAAKESELIVLANDKDLDFENVTKSFYSSNSADSLDIYAVWLSE